MLVVKSVVDRIRFFIKVSLLYEIESTFHARHVAKEGPDHNWVVHKPDHSGRLCGHAYLELLPLLEGEASLADLLAPAAALVRVAHHRVLVSVRVEARVDVQGEVRLTGADVHAKAATNRSRWRLNIFPESASLYLI